MIMKTSETTFAETLEQAHRDLLSDLQHLKEAVRSGFRESPTGLGTCLRELQTHLADHFRFEEQDGYLAPVLKEEPRFGPVIEELLAEHRQLTQALDALLQEIRNACILPDDFGERIRAWVKRVRHHEARENALVQEAYYCSAAVGD
jgi:iron-sulfur cluster repair protein YtfE (RIC family)